MRDATIARNYAEVLHTLATRAGDTEGWGRSLTEVADAVGSDVTLRHFLESPRVAATQKREVLGKAFAGRVPPTFVRFLQALVDKRRHLIIPEIATAYQNLLDESQGRVHAHVTFARPVTDEQRDHVARQLSETLGKQVVAHVTIDPAIVGGVVVKVGDRVMDGSVRRRLRLLRERMVYGAAR